MIFRHLISGNVDNALLPLLLMLGLPVCLLLTLASLFFGVIFGLSLDNFACLNRGWRLC
jgi:hypothetical protein